MILCRVKQQATMRPPDDPGSERGGPAGEPSSAGERTGRDPRSVAVQPRSLVTPGFRPQGAADGFLPSGTRLGKYQIVRQLGQGGMGAVFEAVHTGIGKSVAIKTMNPALTSDPRSEERFLREAEAASRLEHPHVVGVTDFGSDAGVIYLVMELLRGEDLAALIARAPAGLETGFVADIMLAVCAGVFAAHQTGVVHRDLKPQNIFLSHTALGEVLPKVLDFGISKMVNRNDAHSLTQSGSVMGTTHYLSPEQVQGAPLDGRSDEYALGVILYECLTGRRPHEGETLYAIMRSISEGTFPPPRVMRPDLPPEMEAVVLRALGKRADDRFPSVHALGRALLGLASPKGRMIWSDYFNRPLGASGPATAGSSRQPWAAQPISEPATVSARGTPSDVRPISVIRTNQLTRPATRRWQAMFAVVGLGLAAAAYVTFGPSRSMIGPGKPTSAVVPPALQTGADKGASPSPAGVEATTGRTAAPAGAGLGTADSTAPGAVPRPPETPPVGAEIGKASRRASTAAPVRRSGRTRAQSGAQAPGPRGKRSRRSDLIGLPLGEPGQREPKEADPPPKKPIQGPTGAPILD
jgi:eukaryotic-like serine/threonine-protein kinase